MLPYQAEPGRSDTLGCQSSLCDPSATKPYLRRAAQECRDEEDETRNEDGMGGNGVRDVVAAAFVVVVAVVVVVVVVVVAGDVALLEF